MGASNIVLRRWVVIRGGTAHPDPHNPATTAPNAATQHEVLTFTNGEPFTADAVVAIVDNVINPAKPGAQIDEFGLTGATEQPFPTDGWSGATFTTMDRADGRRFVLKRASPAYDWIRPVPPKPPTSCGNCCSAIPVTPVPTTSLPSSMPRPANS